MTKQQPFLLAHSIFSFHVGCLVIADLPAQVILARNILGTYLST